MRLVLIVFASALALAAQTTYSTASSTDFRVEKIEPSQRSAISAAELQLERASVALAAAQKTAAEAKEKRDAAVAAVTQKYGEFQGSCSTGTLQSTRAFRRIEIRGEYALITSGTETCSLSGWVTLTGNGALLTREGAAIVEGHAPGSNQRFN